MKIIIVHKAKLNFSPPVLSVILNLIDLGHNIVLIDEGIDKKWQEHLANKGVTIHTIKSSATRNPLKKISQYYNFRKKTKELLKQYLPQKKDGLLWIEGSYTILALQGLINKYNYILQIQELGETVKYQLRAINKVIHDAKIVFMPEYNRTILYQIWFKLKNRPIVLPNKPYFIPSEQDIKKLESKYEGELESFKQKKIILYQGHIGKDRDLSAYVQAVKNLGDDYKFVLLGTDYGMVDHYKKIDPNIIHIDFIPAPDYLVFTKHAHIGILSYIPECLNNAFCAPNKIYEYAAYRLPMLGNNIPGLLFPFMVNDIGEIIDENDSASIQNAILKISKNRDEYAENAFQFFESSDNKKIIDKELNSIIL